MKIERKYYPDGTFYPVITECIGDELLTYRINSYEDLWFLSQIKNTLDSMDIKCSLVIPCLLDAQADRRFNYNESHNLKLVCNFINNMKWKSVKIFHPHNQEVVEALIDNVKIISNESFISDILYDISHNDKSTYPTLMDDKYTGPEGYYRDARLDEKLVLMSSDAGGFKPLMKLCSNLNWKGEVESAIKSRKWDEKENKSILTQEIDRKNFDGKDILIIDDLMVYGGTFIGLANILKNRNCGKLYLAISHLTIKNPNPEIEIFDKIFTTNSKGIDYYYYNKMEMRNYDNNLKVIKLFEDSKYDT